MHDWARMRHEVALRRSADSAAEARRALAGVADRVSPQRLEDARLLVSELVTNAVRHAGLAKADRITLVLDARDRCLRIEVRDPGPGFVPGEPPTDPDRPSGWGLYLVRELSDRWGVERDAGTVVWFELDDDGA
jgi:anti-sigma regulatory factor (Ser/Thr protein kinase)